MTGATLYSSVYLPGLSTILALETHRLFTRPAMADQATAELLLQQQQSRGIPSLNFGNATGPSAADGSQFGLGDFFPGYTVGDESPYTSTEGDGTAISATIVTGTQALQTETSQTGDAYRIMQQSSNRDHPDLSNDPIFTQSDMILTGDPAYDPLWDQVFTGCTTTSTYTEDAYTVDVQDIRTCDRIVTDGGQCTVNRSVNLQWANSCADGDLQSAFQTIPGLPGFSAAVDCATSGNIVRTGACYHSNTSEYNCGLYPGPWLMTSIDITVPATDVYIGSQRTRWNGNTRTANIYYTNYGCNDTQRDCRIRFTGSGGDVPTYTLDLYFYYRFEEPDITDVQTSLPPGCETFSGDATCSVNWQCTDNTVRTIDGVDIIPTNAPSLTGLYPGDTNDPICYSATNNFECGSFTGTIDCYIDAQGVEQCPTVDSAVTNSCDDLINAGCAWISDVCISTDVNGDCNAYEVTYDCGAGVEIPTFTRDESTICGGAVRCMGTECVDPGNESNDAFAQAASYLEMMHFLAAETATCVQNGVDVNGAPMIDCMVFNGEAKECKEAFGGQVDCCESPDGVSLSDYMKLAYNSYRIANESGILAAAQDSVGVWDTVAQWTSNAASMAWENTVGSFTTASESIAQATSTSTATELSQQSFLEGIKTQAVQTAAEFTYDVFGQEAAQLLFEPATNLSTGQVIPGQFTGALAGPVMYAMYAYMAYQVAVILIQIIWACEEEEFELGAQVALKSCHYLGSYCADDTPFGCIEKRKTYCCFQSPMARIMQEQIRPLIPRDWGTAEDPDCSGIFISELQTVDFSQVDLSEWTAILQLSDMLPADIADAEQRYSMDGIAYDGDASLPRLNTEDRAVERLEQTDIEGAREQMRQDLWGNQ